MGGDWKVWVPLEEEKIKGNYYIQSVEDTLDGLKVVMESELDDFKVRITFSDYVWSYRNTNESYCWQIFSELSDKHGDDFYKDWAFFKIENSEYLKWISNNSAKIYDDGGAEHFVIKGLEQVVDIINDEEPKIEIVSR